MWQQVMIAVLVPLAVCYVVWTFLSRAQRRRMRQLLPIREPAGITVSDAPDDGCGKCAIRNEHQRPQQH